MTITWHDADAELKQYIAEYAATPFTPFPSVEAAVEAVTETASWIYSTEGEEFVIEVARRLNAWVEKKRAIDGDGVTHDAMPGDGAEG